MPYTIPTRNLSLAETYILASKAKAKLTREARRPDINLRRLVVNANFLDNIMDKITSSSTNYNTVRFVDEPKPKTVTVAVEPPAYSSPPVKDGTISHFTENHVDDPSKDQTPQYVSTVHDENGVFKYEISADSDSDSDSDFDSDSEADYDSDSDSEDSFDITHEYQVTSTTYDRDELELIVMGQSLMENQDLQFATPELASSPNYYDFHADKSTPKKTWSELPVLAELEEDEEEDEEEGEIMTGDIANSHFYKFPFYQHGDESASVVVTSQDVDDDEVDDDADAVSDTSSDNSSAPSLSYSSSEEDELDSFGYQDELESTTYELVMVQSHPAHVVSSIPAAKISVQPNLTEKSANERCSNANPNSILLTELSAI
ncbi:hypothetical protein NADFUDRAFT_45628 [Nadsonia fulvescens var. elongata DSM 6958]|uniref:Uncharacterized protein n=1 Tax=Nadsonia fulvescens var. elongata DSM 6958 TaxID=857566 RepID=A0A1E3PQ34_9ASCO|nr:hypothetical protein NADFUDRAFT_45628 [Nadsonia fulvescens var. elongata DSM 6958]